MIVSSKIDTKLSTPYEGLGEVLGQIEGTVAVLGAGGKMGLHICRMLKTADESVARDRQIFAVSRFSSVHGREQFEQHGITTLPCELEDDVALEALPAVPNMIFMAGAKFGTGKQPDLLRRMNEELPRRVAAKYRGVRSLVFSTGCVYSHVAPATGGSRESDPTAPPGAYAQSCLMREVAFAEAARNFGTPSALIRLNYSTEYRYGVLFDIASKVYAEQPVTLDMGWVNVIWQRDAVDQILRAFPLTTTEPFILNIAGETILSVRELALRFGEIFGKEPQFIGQEGTGAWLNNAQKSHELFGKPQTSLEQMIDWTAQWIAQGGESFGKPTGFDNREGKF